MSKFQPMLAGNVELSTIVYPVLCTPKLDGIRCIVKDSFAVSRTLKLIPNKVVQMLLSTIQDDVDGELVIPGAAFNDTQSAIMNESGSPTFVYHVFDVINKESYSDRMKTLEKIKLPSMCKKVLPVLIHNEKELLEYEKKCLDESYEGVMIRSVNGPYKYGRSTTRQGYLLKLKRFQDSEGTIIGFKELQHNTNEEQIDKLGHTKRAHKKAGMVAGNTLGSFIVQDGDKVFNVATGMTEEERQNYWNTKDSMLGKLVKYKFQEFGSKNLPRFPVFLGIRHPDDT